MLIGKPQPPRLQTPTTPVHLSKGVTATPSAAPQSRRESASPPPPSATAEFDLAKLEGKDHGPSVKEGDVGEEGGEGGGIGAADYDPSLDRREDEKRRFGIEAPPGEGAAHKDENAMIIDGDDGEVEEVEVTDDEGDEEEEVDDMFALAFGGDEDEEKEEKKKEKVKKKKKVRKVRVIQLFCSLDLLPSLVRFRFTSASVTYSSLVLPLHSNRLTDSPSCSASTSTSDPTPGRLRCRRRRLLHHHLGRVPRQWAVPSLFEFGQRHVCERC